MGCFFEEFCNRALCRELKREEGNEVVIFTIDGFTYFGLIDVVDDRILTLSPANGQNFVKILTPGNDRFNEIFSHIDICTIAGKARGVNNFPF